MSAVYIDPIIEILKKEYESKKSRNSAYSLRAFSRSLEIDPSNLSKILNNQIAPGDKLRKKLAKKLGIETNDFKVKSTVLDNSLYNEHALDVFTTISDCNHYSILEIIKLKKYEVVQDREEMATDLNLSLVELNKSITRLIQVGLLVDEEGFLKNTENFSSSIININTSKAHRNHQAQILENAIDALEVIPLSSRSQSSMTMAIDKRKLPQALEMIKEFRRGLAQFLSDSEELDDVYNLSVSLFPSTNIYQSEEG